MGEIEKLKEELKGWQQSVLVRDAARQGLKISVEQKEDEIEELKYHLYLAQKDWKVAREKVEYYQKKIIVLPSKVRRWNKDNVGKVFDYFERKK